MKPDAPKAFHNRELSWLAFNRRVLAQAQNPSTPLMERIKFLAIVSSNLDEFFMVRVAMVQRAIEAEAGALGPDRMGPGTLMGRIAERAHALVGDQYACYTRDILPALQKEQIEIVRRPDYTPEDVEALSAWFDDYLFPILTPQAIDSAHPFPLLANCAVYLLFRIEAPADLQAKLYEQTDTVLVQVPAGVNRFVPLPANGDGTRLAVLDDVVIQFGARLIGGYNLLGAYPFRVTRDADIQVEEEQAEDLMDAIEQLLRHRRRGSPVRLEVRDDMPEGIESYLRLRLDVEARDLYRVPAMVDLKSLFGLLKRVGREDLRDPPWPPQPHPAFLDEQVDLFALMRERDLILHHPYQSFDPVVRLVERAADDPDVLAIKMTLYRVSGDSPIVAALMRAAQHGKQVTVVVELRARFDEEANIQWARRLDDAGAHVRYGVSGYKTHAKALLIVRSEPDGIRRYVHLGTGNYNDSTARLYTDLGYLTTRPEFCADISAFFNVITGYSVPPNWKRIEMAPTGLRAKVLSLIEREIEKHTPETPGRIRAKLNALIDPEVIQALYRASAAGVTIELMVRGMCRLRAGVKGLSANIRVVSVVDRFLEHSRIYHFHNGGAEEVYCASADWMERNLDRRLELFFPLVEENIRAVALNVLDAGFSDNVSAWEMTPDGTYVPVRRGRRKAFRSQEVLYRLAVETKEKARPRQVEGVFQSRKKPPRRRT